MAKAQGHIPNLVNGVSQQAPQMRLASQATDVDNFYTTLVDGLVPRPRTDHQAKLNVTIASDDFTHFIMRDQSERYLVRITTAGNVKVWDMAGNEKVVNTPIPTTYLNGLVSAKQQLKALTIADHTFIVNTSKVVAAGAATQPTRPFEALMTVFAGNYGRTYRVQLNSSQVAFCTAPNGSTAVQAPYIDTVFIASTLYTCLNTGAPTIAAPWTSGTAGAGNTAFGADGLAAFGAAGFNSAPWALGRYHSTIYIRNTNVDFTLAFDDGQGGNAGKMAKGIVQKFTDLPLYGPDGFVIKVSGDKATNADDYWVEFQKNADADGTGVWKECVAPGSKLGLDKLTMPHLLRRELDGTFTFTPATWDDRKCGDVATVPDPSFVGQTVEEVFFTDQRFGILTKENYVMSESANFFNFFRTTLTTLLDTDPIDSAASHVKVSLLRHAVPFSEMMLLFSDQTQFRLKGNELLTPKTVNAKPLSEFGSKPSVAPVVSGSSIWFVNEGDTWGGLNEYLVDKSVESASSDNVSGHCPKYIPAGIDKLITSNDPDVNLVLLTTTGDPDAIYAYKFKYRGQDKIQSAWQRWTYPDCIRVVDMVFENKKVWLVMNRDGLSFIESFNAEEGSSDTGLTYKNYLDRHTVRSTLSYDAVNDRTTFTGIPYDIVSNGAKFVIAPGGTEPAGLELDPYSTTAGGTWSVTFEGNLTGNSIRVGFPYEARFRFSPFYQRGQDGQAQTDGLLQLMWLSINYSKSAYFRVEVTCEGRALVEYPYTGQVIGDPDTMTGILGIGDGRFSVPIFTRNDRATIDIVSDTWRPCAFSSADWRGMWNPNTRQG